MTLLDCLKQSDLLHSATYFTPMCHLKNSEINGFLDVVFRGIDEQYVKK